MVMILWKSLVKIANKFELYSNLTIVGIFSKFRQIIPKHSMRTAVSRISSLVSSSLSHLSLATIMNLPMAGRSSSGSRPRCGPLSDLTSFHWVSQFDMSVRLSCSFHIATKRLMNSRKYFSSF